MVAQPSQGRRVHRLHGHHHVDRRHHVHRLRGEISTLQAEIQQLQGATSTPATTTTTQGTTGHKAVSASGKESLNKIAAANGSSAAAIAEYTLANKKNISATLRKYLTAGNYQARIPKGLVFWVPTTSSSSS